MSRVRCRVLILTVGFAAACSTTGGTPGAGSTSSGTAGASSSGASSSAASSSSGSASGSSSASSSGGTSSSTTTSSGPPAPACVTNLDCESDAYCSTAGECVDPEVLPADVTELPYAGAFQVLSDPLGIAFFNAWYTWGLRCWFGPFAEQFDEVTNRVHGPFVAFIQRLEGEYRFGHRQFSAAKVQACVEHLRDRPCGRGVRLADCLDPMEGALGDLAFCSHPRECRSDTAACDTSDVIGDGSCGRCRLAPGNVGDVCPCADGLHCSPQGRCAANLNVGDACVWDFSEDPCGADAWCSNGSCAPRRMQGSACQTSRECAEGLTCNGNDLCVPPAAEGGDCTFHVGCQGALACIGGICQDPTSTPAVGDTCSADPDCGYPSSSGLTCADGQCVPVTVAALGEPCPSDAFCAGEWSTAACFYDEDPAAPWSCQPLAGLGMPCGGEHPLLCEGGAYCRVETAGAQGTCVRMLALGQACRGYPDVAIEYADDCMYGASCQDGVCQYVYPGWDSLTCG